MDFAYQNILSDARKVIYNHLKDGIYSRVPLEVIISDDLLGIKLVIYPNENKWEWSYIDLIANISIYQFGSYDSPIKALSEATDYLTEIYKPLINWDKDDLDRLLPDRDID